MKNYIFPLIISIIISTLFISCSEDFLNKPPLDQISNESYWKTANDLNNYVIQFYPIFPDYGDGGYAGIYAQDAAYSDNMISGAPSPLMNGTRTVPPSDGGWNWSRIRDINIFFDNYQKCESVFEEYRNSLGEAHFFKAYLHFDLVRSFGDVPWYTNSIPTDSEDLYAPKTARNQVVDSILSHLDKAIEYLDPLDKVDGGNNRLSVEAALLFKSRVALFEGSWQKYHVGTNFGTSNVDPSKYFRAAVDAAEELIDGNYKVGIYNTGTPDTDYSRVFNQDDMSDIGNEIILWKDYDKALGMQHEAQRYLTIATDDKSVTLSLVGSYLGLDGQPYDFEKVKDELKGNSFLSKIAEDCDPRLKQTIWIPGQLVADNTNGTFNYDLPPLDKTSENRSITGFQLKKGANPYSPGAAAVYGGNSETGSIVFRFAEALLNYAEAKYELDGNVDYNKSINVLRARAGMPDFDPNLNDPNLQSHSDYGYSIDNALYEIRRERRIELACEGFRAMDWKRWRAHTLFSNKRPVGYPFDQLEWGDQVIPVPVNEEGLLDPYYDNLGSTGYQFNAERDYLDPIPNNELTLNPNLTQNPGW